ncbi:MAG TPA: DUF3459 domain-containing protein, partial [Caulobacter sp.]|nr:DUF3459 domain-containing protein [Caulobacter sp.]
WHVGAINALIAFRRGSADLRAGDYRDVDPEHPRVFAYRRGRLLVVLNFGREPVRYVLPSGLRVEGAAFGVAQVADGVLALNGWDFAILTVSEL